MEELWVFIKARMGLRHWLKPVDGLNILSISEHIFAAELKLLCLLSIGFKNRGISSDIPHFSWRIFAHVTRLDQSRASENIWWIIMQFITGRQVEAHSFPRASLAENCSLLGTDNFRGQMSEHIFAPNEGYCLYITEEVHVKRSLL